VVKTIELLSAAELNLWMITGDKAETAVAIGRMCGLLKPDHELELLLKLTGDSLRQKLDDLAHFFSRTQSQAVTAATASPLSTSSSMAQVLMRTFSSTPAPVLGPASTPAGPGTDPMNADKGARDSALHKRESFLDESLFGSQFLPTSHHDDESRSFTASYRSGVCDLALSSGL
jgi:hypothetical protein